MSYWPTDKTVKVGTAESLQNRFPYVVSRDLSRTLTESGARGDIVSEVTVGCPVVCIRAP